MQTAFYLFIFLQHIIAVLISQLGKTQKDLQSLCANLTAHYYLQYLPDCIREMSVV